MDAGAFGIHDKPHRDRHARPCKGDVLALLDAGAFEPDGGRPRVPLGAEFDFDGELIAQAGHVVVEQSQDAQVLAQAGVPERDDVQWSGDAARSGFGVAATIEPAIRGDDHRAYGCSCPLALQHIKCGAEVRCGVCEGGSRCLFQRGEV